MGLVGGIGCDTNCLGYEESHILLLLAEIMGALDVDNLRLAIIGCGTVTETLHLPAIARSEHFTLAALVDSVLQRAQQLADTYNVPIVADDYRKVADEVDAAIVALPNYLHAPVTKELLRNGIHVLVEKPMALTGGECEEMIKEADSAGAVLAVGMDFRFFGAFQFVKKALDTGLLGNITGFDLRQGFIFQWPAKTDYFLRKDNAGGGVLIDIGVHELDLLLWWLGDYESVEYYDDAMGGVEADCELHLKLQCGAHGIVELSRTRKLRNTCIISGENATLEVGIWGYNPPVTLALKNHDNVLTGSVALGGLQDEGTLDPFCRQLDDFANSILSNRVPFVSGKEGKRAIQLIETCYAARQLIMEPWNFKGALRRV
jgi:predicted dehydrogenase